MKFNIFKVYGKNEVLLNFFLVVQMVVTGVEKGEEQIEEKDGE